jgi:AbrB family looped-hinge helix DNA binding protein
MTLDNDTEETTDALAEPDSEQVVITDWQVGSDGRLTIPAEKREKYDIVEGDYVDAVLVTEGD